MAFDTPITVTKVFDVMTIHIENGTHRQITDRFAYGLSFCVTPGGRLVYRHNGKEYLSDHTNAILLPMGETYTLHGSGEGEFPLINFYTTDAFKIDHFELFKLDNPAYFVKTYEYIKSMSAHDQPYCSAKAMSAFYDMLSHLMNNPFNAGEEMLSAALAYIDRHFTDPELSVEDAAEHVHLCAGYFRRAFRAKYRMCPKEYITNSRVSLAKELLASGGESSVSSVALKCGFTNVYHFDRVFKEHTGCTPTEYIRRFGQILS